MPANLPPPYFDAEKRFRAAKTPEDKIQALETMLAIMPKHKGTDKLRADLRRKIARISDEASHKTATSRLGHYIRPEGAGQIVLVGLPNVGKSQLITALTKASSEIADYPFTTKAPVVGMVEFENIQIQLIDTPAVMGPDSRMWLNNLARNADLVCIMVDLNDSPSDQATIVLQELESMGIIPVTDVITDLNIGKRQRKMLVIANKSDLNAPTSGQQELEAYYGQSFPIAVISALKKTNLESLKSLFFEQLSIIRVYTKTPGKKADLDDPVILPKGSTMKEGAESIHKDFRARLKYALIWGSGKFPGQRVGPDHVLQDNDIIEFHI